MKILRRSIIATAAMAAVLAGTACAQINTPSTAHPPAPKVGQAGKDVIWVPTPQALVDRMLDMAQLTPSDRLVDLGSGDGRTVITAAKRGAMARGIEFNVDMVALSRQRAEEEGVSERATFEQGDIFRADFSDATVVTLFLLPTLNVKLRPVLLEMRPGTRIVANSFDMAEWQPDERAYITEGCNAYCTAMMWIVPAKFAGIWEMDGKTLELKQSFQMLEGSLRDDSSTQLISGGRVEGSQVEFAIGSDWYQGEVKGARLEGTINGSRPWQAARSGAAQSQVPLLPPAK